jgi:hypothetical protein
LAAAPAFFLFLSAYIISSSVYRVMYSSTYDSASFQYRRAAVEYENWLDAVEQ